MLKKMRRTKYLKIIENEANHFNFLKVAKALMELSKDPDMNLAEPLFNLFMNYANLDVKGEIEQLITHIMKKMDFVPLLDTCLKLGAWDAERNPYSHLYGFFKENLSYPLTNYENQHYKRFIPEKEIDRIVKDIEEKGKNFDNISIIRFLGFVGPEHKAKAKAILLKLLCSDPNFKNIGPESFCDGTILYEKFVREIIYSLAQLKETRIVDPLINYIEKTGGWENKEIGIHALGILGEKKGLEYLKKIFLDDLRLTEPIAHALVIHLPEEEAFNFFIDIIKDSYNKAYAYYLKKIFPFIFILLSHNPSLLTRESRDLLNEKYGQIF